MNREPIDGRISTLQVALNEHLTADELKPLCALVGAKPYGRKADLAGAVMRHLEGDGLRAAWQSLDELQRAAVAEVVHSSTGQFSSERFRAKYGKDPTWSTSDEHGSDRRPSALSLFFYLGVMPDDLKARLSAFVPPPVKATISSQTELPSWPDGSASRSTGGRAKVPLAVHETEQVAQRELLSVLRLVDAGKVAVSGATRRPAAAAMEAITAVLEGGDYYPRLPVKSRWSDENAGPIRAFAWPLLIQAGGLAQLAGSKLELTKAGRRALGQPAADSIRGIWAKWMETRILDELSRIECVKGQSGKGGRGLTSVASRRQAVRDILTECPQGAWVTVDELHRHALASGRRVYVTRNPWSLYLVNPQYGSLAYGGIEVLELRYLACLLLEYAATLGLIDVALVPPAGARRDFREMWGTDDLVYFSRYDGLAYFRLNRLGASCLGTLPDYLPAPTPADPLLRILPNLEIAAMGRELDQADRLALDAYAIRVSDRMWRLEPARLLSAIDEGRPLEEVRSFLEAKGTGIPETVSRLLDDVAARAGKVRDRGLARLLECADAETAALVASDSRTARHCMRAGERHLVVPAASEPAFRRSLRETGFLVAPTDAEPRRRHPAPRKGRAEPLSSSSEGMG